MTSPTSIITSIERQKDKQRYSIFVDGRFAFGVHEDILIKHRLRKGQAIDAAELEAIVAAEERQQAYLYAVRSLGVKARTRHELSVRLTGKGFAPETVEDALRRLAEERYIDDAAFAKRWAAERLRGQAKGKRLIQHELKGKGVPETLIRDALSELDANDEWESALRLARKKWGSDASEPKRRQQRVYAMLIRRGFAAGLAGRAVRAVSNERAEEPDEELPE